MADKNVGRMFVDAVLFCSGMIIAALGVLGAMVTLAFGVIAGKFTVFLFGPITFAALAYFGFWVASKATFAGGSAPKEETDFEKRERELRDVL